MRLISHFLRRILAYDLPLSAAGALATWAGHPGVQGRSASALVGEIGVRFVLIACTVGYVFSFLLYSWLGRKELPLYAVCGYHLVRVVGISCVLNVLVFGAMLAAGLLLARWLNP